ncbi:DUF4041 domain-containing protein [Spongisporangium articulatum]
MPLFGARRQARELGSVLADVQAENAALREQLAELGALDILQLRDRRRQLEDEVRAGAAALDAALSELDQAKRAIVETREVAILQEVGVYEYQHPLQDAVAYKAELAELKNQIKAMTLRDGGAVTGVTDWTVNGSAAQGRTMVRETSKLMLRAYNAEADNLARSLKPYKLATARERLDKVAFTIEKLGKTLQIRISPEYHRLRMWELSLTADYLEKVAVEKEREREEKARLREEQRVQAEIERERARLIKEQQHYLNALTALQVKGDQEAVLRMQTQLAEIESAIKDVDYRAANIRAGYVYVISNIGAFGPGMVKIGMTRRLDPMDRVKELGDASVPFRFDVHALFFSDDAVGIEAKLHAHFAELRVNQINRRREFFYATPVQVRDQLLQLTGDLLTFDELPEAIEYRQSATARSAVATVATDEQALPSQS